MKQESSASHCQVSIARQRSEFASETSPGPRLRSSDHEILQIPSWTKIYPPGDLRAHTYNKHGAATGSILDT